MFDYALSIEKYLAHQIWFVFQLHNGKNTPTAYSTTLEPFTNKFNCTISTNRSRHILDFNDFFDYATSEIANTKININSFHENEIYLFDALPNSLHCAAILSAEDKKFSIIGAAFVRNGHDLAIMAQIRTYEEFEISDKYDSIRESHFSKKLFEKSHNFPFIFGYLTLRQINNELIEVLRSEIIPPVILGAEDYSIHSLGKDNYYTNLPIHTTYPQLLKQEREVLFDRDEYFFQVIRLLPCLPDYYAFMYDLVINERKKIGVRPSVGNHKKQKKGRSIYKIIKSIRISYEAEEKVREKFNANKRTWTPPPYKYLVRGHWRVLAQSHWIGHDPEGKEILGKTWVNEYEKGEDEAVSVEVSQREPNSVIKLKQTLAYARDVLHAHQVSATSVSILQIVTQQNDDSPTADWIYEERKKLTAGLRYLILKRDNFKCKLCGASGLENGVQLEVDHIVPISEWGKTEEKNLQTACNRCNRGKGKLL